MMPEFIENILKGVKQWTIERIETQSKVKNVYVDTIEPYLNGESVEYGEYGVTAEDIIAFTNGEVDFSISVNLGNCFVDLIVAYTHTTKPFSLPQMTVGKCNTFSSVNYFNAEYFSGIGNMGIDMADKETLYLLINTIKFLQFSNYDTPISYVRLPMTVHSGFSLIKFGKTPLSDLMGKIGINSFTFYVDLLFTTNNVMLCGINFDGTSSSFKSVTQHDTHIIPALLGTEDMSAGDLLTNALGDETLHDKIVSLAEFFGFDDVNTWISTVYYIENYIKPEPDPEPEPEPTTEVEVTIEHENGTSEFVNLNPDLTYADQGYSGYYSQNTFDSSPGVDESANDFLVDSNYPANGVTIYSYCNDTYNPEPEPDPEPEPEP